MKVIIAGSRTITDYSLLELAMYESPFHDTVDTIVSGGAKGVDELGERYADSWGKNKVVFHANWSRYGRGAGAVRNEAMAEYADGLLAVWDGESKGTKHMIDTMQEMGKPVKVVIIAGQR